MKKEWITELIEIPENEMVLSDGGLLCPPRDLKLCSGYRCKESGGCLRSFLYYMMAPEERGYYDRVGFFAWDYKGWCKVSYSQDLQKTKEIYKLFTNPDILEEIEYDVILPIIVKSYKELR